nr:MAG TPA: hypothetical protein [Caudoviricetes sp.]
MSGLEGYIYYDKPIPYKDLMIYPALMSEYIDFHWAVTSLLLDKNSTPDVKVISMTYLSYLYYLVSNNEGEPYLAMLKYLLLLILHINVKEENRITFYEDANGKALFSIDGKEYDNDDLMNIKRIVFEQNCINDIDESIQKEVRDAMEKAEEYRMQQNANKMCSLEDQMICVSISSPYKLEEIYKLTIRKFSKMLQRIDHKLHYQIYLSAELSGMVEFKDKNSLVHWMNDLTNKDIYQSSKIDMNDMNKKINDLNR